MHTESHNYSNIWGKTDKSRYPLVSIITPSYNQGEFIRETIESVLSQDYPNIEYIIIDGGSTDNTIQILQEYESKLSFLSEIDEGQADAVNKGIAFAQGEIIGWLNSDDLYYPNAVSRIVEIFNDHPAIDVVYGEGCHITKSGTVIARYPTESFHYQKLAERCFICQPTVFIRKKCLNSIGSLDKNLDLCMDYDLWIRIGKEYNFYYYPEEIAKSRIYPENKTLSRIDEVFTEVLEMIHSHYGYYPISWIYGYEKYKSQSKGFGRIFLNTIINFLRMNCSNQKQMILYIIYLCSPQYREGKIYIEILNLCRMTLEKKGNFIKIDCRY